MSLNPVCKLSALVAGIMLLGACQQQGSTESRSSQSAMTPTQADAQTQTMAIDHQRYQLENGLTVILHEDHSDPLVHIDVTYHVGSAREEPGKSGFAHFFEHMMFQGSENVADEQHFQIITEAGGKLNGSTNTDRTNYYATVPANQLQKVLWLEADRMGYLLPAVDQKKFENQRETVKNERAQRIDNQPYGLRQERTAEALYPAGHPYSWLPIGYVEDLDRVDVTDLKAFFKRWYGPNNAVLTIGGDIDIAQTKAWVEQYFGPIAQGPAVAKASPEPVTLEQDRYITLQDNVHLPLLQITYPTVYARHEDEAPLDVLSNILGGGKTSLLYKNLVKAGLAVQATVNHPCRELACEFQMLALANPSSTKDLAQLEQVISDTLSEFEQRGVKPDDLERTKASIEASTVFGLQSVAGKVSALANGETFQGQPDLIAQDIERYNAVTASEVMRVYRKYIKNGHGVFLSVVPNGKSELAVKPQNFTLPERDISSTDTNDPLSTTAPAADDFDRSVVPPAGPAPIVEVPDYWEASLPHEVTLLGVTSSETPTVTFTLRMEGGIVLDAMDKAGTATLTAMMMNESTQRYTNEQMANELAKLGSRIRFDTSGRYTQVRVTSLTKNLEPTLALLEEKLLRPAFKESDFSRLKEQLMQSMQQQLKSSSALASRARDLVLFGDKNRVSLPDEGTLETIANITLADVKAYYQQYYSPNNAHAVVVSNLPQAKVMQAFEFLSAWQPRAYEINGPGSFPEHQQQTIYLVDKPDSVQSVVKLVRRGPLFDATGEYFKSRLMNFALGGAFNSRVNLNLREDKGYTYGASTAFVGGKTVGWFEAAADLNGPNTAAGITEILDEIKRYKAAGMTPQELAFMRSAYTLSDALDYETPASKARFLSQLQAFDLASDYRSEQLEIIRNISLQELNQLASEQLAPEQLQIIVVGDKSSVLPQLQKLDIPIVELSLQDNRRRRLTP
ncbi:insulinase family protein [Salinimonas marina]|uniref:Insulinase family protein n=1 Tax=Salinimonas marina TaxID=2785918 RepID=A0A7S9DVY9_9ALTE|nr:pitrilysin family protein [Salinimonas marina]QPG04860.1 insulinase family protein [Salinimonas marina]